MLRPDVRNAIDLERRMSFCGQSYPPLTEGRHMPASLIVFLAIHLVAAVFWAGGMAFAYMILRPAAGPLDPPMRLPLWRRVFARFLPWVGVSVVALLASGFMMVFQMIGDVASLPLYVNLMMGIGIIMMLLY